MQDVSNQLNLLFTELPLVWIGFIFILSLLIGSFLNVVIHRIPIMLERDWKSQATEILSSNSAVVSASSAEASRNSSKSEPTAYSLQPTAPFNLIIPRSRCPNCNTLITATQNIPLLSYLFLKGKCANCGVRISPRYPIVELSTALLSAIVAWKFGFSWTTGAALLLTWTLIALSCIDFDTQLLPDNMTLPLMWIGLLLSLWGGDLQNATIPVDPRSSIIGAVVGYLSLWSVYWLFKLVTGKEGMGYGDFKLFAAFGAWMGWQMLPLIILLSAFTGAVVGIALIVIRGRDRNIPIPFGPYLAAAGWIALLWGDELVGSYLRMSGLGP